MGWTDFMVECNGAWVGTDPPEAGDDLGWAWYAPDCSTDIAAAWEAVEKLRGQGWHVCVCVGAQTSCCLTHTGEARNADATGETAPLAICRAALKAVERKESG